jgi:hypothetical protein
MNAGVALVINAPAAAVDNFVPANCASSDTPKPTKAVKASKGQSAR